MNFGIFDILIHTDLKTKIFVVLSIILLGVGQYLALKSSFKYILIPALHILFGLLLSMVSRYHILVHLMVYIGPSAILSTILFFMYNRKAHEAGPYDISYNTNKGKLTINPFSGVCILGTPKAGKTASLIRPTIQQLAEKGYAGVIYDYKRFDLTRTAYFYYMNNKEVDFRMVNFFDLCYSHRINPISPSVIQHPAFAVEAAFVFLANMMGSPRNESNSPDRYWVDSAAGVLAGIIWRLRTDFPDKCDLPHAISIAIKKDVKALTAFLEKNEQSVFLASSYFKSLVSDKQLAGILGTLGSSLSKAALPEIFYALSGDEVNLQLNDPEHPTLLCLSNTQQLDTTYAPVLALIISVCIKLMNQEGKHHSAVLLDEAPTLVIPNFDNIPATARSNRIATFFCAQDMVQGESGYGRIGRDKILATLSTHLYGRVTDPGTAERYSKMFGTIEKVYTSSSRKAGSWTSSGYTASLRDISKYKPELFHHLKTGEFIGVIADGNMPEINAKFDFIAEINEPLPMIRNISREEVQAIFETIINESVEMN